MLMSWRNAYIPLHEVMAKELLEEDSQGKLPEHEMRCTLFLYAHAQKTLM